MNNHRNSCVRPILIAIVAFTAGYFVRHVIDSGERRVRPVRRDVQQQVFQVENTKGNAAISTASSIAEPIAEPLVATRNTFLQLTTTRDRAQLFSAISTIGEEWHPGNAVMLLEVVRFVRSEALREAALEVLQSKTGQNFGGDMNAWYRWVWRQEYQPHPEYSQFKADLYSRLDKRFREYFAATDDAEIRLDEIRWGGVRRDGIPPLKDPETLSPEEADYLADTNVVFGVEINGEARAYPKRILAWHEMVKDTVGGESINGVYCTLCGSMIVYRTHIDGKHYELGTSGFLYRSNKLMYDHETKSFWSTLDGRPVVGPLVGKDIKLEPLSVVTTTWGEWRQRHLDTTVISLETGHDRNYDEGAAYRAYFATDRLMFEVPKHDGRLKNKDEVLAIRTAGNSKDRLAISAKFLKEHPIYHDAIGETKFVVLTDGTGANRVYESREVEFVKQLPQDRVQAADGSEWTVSESALTNVERNETLQRLPAHRAFWFGWYSVFPDTRLVK